MGNRRALIRVLAVVVLGASLVLARPVSAAEPHVTLLVGFVPGSPAAAHDDAHSRAGARASGAIERLSVDVVEVPASRADEIARRYERHPAVEFAERDGRVEAFDTPDDPKFTGGHLWGLHNTGQSGGTADKDVDAPEGWKVAGIPVSGTWPAEAFTVGVVDTGADVAHPDLKGRIVACHEDRTAAAEVSDGCADAHGHGTHVAGTVAAAGNNAKGVIGVAPTARLAICAALDGTGAGFDSDVVTCIDHLTASAAALNLKVINLSLGGEESSAIERAVDAAAAAGILVVAAAGNDGDTTLRYPAAYDSVVSVAAVDRSGKVAWFSNNNSAVELSAPGVDVLSTVPGGYGEASGTSMATPHVAGIAALVADRLGLTASAVRARLQQTAEDEGAAGRDSSYGYGRVNLCLALGACQPVPGGAVAPQPPTGAAATRGDRQASLEWSAPIDDGGVPVTSYTVTASPGGSYKTVSAADTSAVVAGLHNGTSYTFAVTATNDAGTSGPSDPSNSVTPASAPGAPTSVAATGGNAKATVTWKAPADDGGATIKSYTVTASPGGKSATVAGTATKATVSFLTNGTSYTFKVTATNIVGQGAPSSSSNSVAPATVPGAPQSVTATAGDASATVSWTAPASNGGSTITGYTITASPGGSTTSAGSTVRSITVGGLADGTSYTFTVRAVNLLGSGSGTTSGAVTTDPALPRSGYWMVDERGVVHAFGEAPHLGNAPVGAPAQDLEPTPTGNGYWVVDAAGSVYSFGDAPFFGGAGALQPGELVTSLSALPSGDGYWLFTTLGRVVARGAAAHLGDMAGVALNGPVLDSIATPTGAGYYLVGSDGGIFSFGDARFAGSMGGSTINAPVQSLVPDGDGWGYWLVASDGGIFAFDAPFHGSMGGVALNQPIAGMVGMGSGGYLMVAEDGGIFAFGDTIFHGSLGSNPPPAPVTAAALLPR